MPTRAGLDTLAVERASGRPGIRWLFDADRPWAVNGGRVAALLVLFGLRELGAGRLFDIFDFSKPSLIVAQVAKEVVDPSFYRDLGVTSLELILGYASGGAAGIALSILLARWRYVAKICDPFLLALNSVPRIAVAPMLIAWFGIGIARRSSWPRPWCSSSRSSTRCPASAASTRRCARWCACRAEANGRSSPRSCCRTRRPGSSPA